MLSKIIALVVAFPICIFFGVMFIALGLGSYFPQVNYVTASPFVCPNGTLASDIDLRANIRLSSNNVHSARPRPVYLCPPIRLGWQFPDRPRWRGMQATANRAIPLTQ